MSMFDIFVFNLNTKMSQIDIAPLPVLMALGNTGRNCNLQLQLLKLKTSHWIRRLAIFVNAIRSFITKNQSPGNPGILPYMASFSHMGFFAGSATDWKPSVFRGEMFKELEFFPCQRQNQALRNFPWNDLTRCIHPNAIEASPKRLKLVFHKWGPLSFRIW